ncbi:hypothetical protein TRVL_08351 [Trypanosoma vivax]|nr:hypothetical protein TRVL_08351 [Trypanosoma vivax]
MPSPNSLWNLSWASPSAAEAFWSVEETCASTAITRLVPYVRTVNMSFITFSFFTTSQAAVASSSSISALSADVFASFAAAHVSLIATGSRWTSPAAFFSDSMPAAIFAVIAEV